MRAQLAKLRETPGRKFPKPTRFEIIPAGVGAIRPEKSHFRPPRNFPGRSEVKASRKISFPTRFKVFRPGVNSIPSGVPSKPAGLTSQLTGVRSKLPGKNETRPLRRPSIPLKPDPINRRRSATAPCNRLPARSAFDRLWVLGGAVLIARRRVRQAVRSGHKPQGRCFISVGEFARREPVSV